MSARLGRHPLLRACGLSLIASLLYTASLAPFDLGWTAFAVAWPLAGAFLDPRRPLTLAQATLAGLFFGELTTLAVGGHWLFHATHGFFEQPAAFSLLFTLAVTITHAGAFIAMSVVASSRLRALAPGLRIVGFASLWTALELARSVLLYGCPWDLLGHAFSRSTALMHWTSLAGVYGLSWLAVMAGAAVGTAWVERDSGFGALRYAAVGLLAPAAAVAAGGWMSVAAPAAAGEPLTVGIVQTAIDKRELWLRELRMAHLQRFLELSRSAELAGSDLIVWTENSVPFVLDANTDALARIQALADETGAAILVGAPRSEDHADGKGRLYNSIFFFRPEQPDYLAYDKIRLLPYIEAVPAFARPFVERTAGIEYTAGDHYTLFEHAGWKIAPLICFESTYPTFAREYARRGAHLLVNVSNDSWFDRGAAPEQHFAMSVFRAPETGLPMVRVANGGVSAALDSRGATLASPPARTDAVARATLYRPSGKPAAYALAGDAFAWGCVVTSGLLLWLARRRERVRPVADPWLTDRRST